MDETDDALANYRDIIVGKALADPTILDATDNIIHSYSFRRLTDEEAADYRTRFYDSTMFIETEGEFEPVRVMKSCFLATDMHHYELELRLSTLERDDLIQRILYYLLALYAVLLCCILFSTRLILQSIFRPIHLLLKWLDSVALGQPAPYLDKDVRIREFRMLNRAAIEMHERVEQTYQEQKQFIENASHELQTPLAVIRGKLELLTEQENLNEEDMKIVDNMYGCVTRAVNLNKSLLLLSRIQNEQYTETTLVDMNAYTKEIMMFLPDLYEEKQLHYTLNEQGECHVEMNKDLAQVLLNNLIKNAFVHTPEQGHIDINILPTSVEVINDGTEPLDESEMYKRFYKGNTRHKGSTGLGLPIVKSICGLYGFELQYSYDGKHHFLLKVVK
jgi:signal transduction histidine kinase